jgi:cytochrome P450
MSQHTQSASLPPKRSGLPLLGSALSFARDPYGFYDDVARRGDVVRFSMGSTEMVGVLHPDGIKQVLVEQFETFRKPDDAGGVDVLADGLLLSDGEQWRTQRERLQPLFYKERIETYAETMGAYAAAIAEDWAEADGSVDLTEATSTYTLRVLGKTLFGIDTADHRRAVRAGADAIRERSNQSPVGVDLPGWLPTPANRRYRRGTAQLDAVVDDLLATRRDTERGEDLLSLLLEAKADAQATITEAEIRSQLMTFLFAGHETSATALTWALYELGRKPEVAERLTAEVDRAIDGPHATLTDLPELDYTEQVLQETLRRYPPAAAIFREVADAVTIDGYRLPADTFVVLPQFHVHTDDRWWDDPDRFDPARWDETSASAEERPEYAYFPFGGGPRHCIGMRFARMELQLALATIVRRCDITHSHGDVSIDVGATVSPGEEIRASFEPRAI